ncbi:MAG: metallophosphoesterase family protein [Chloroflexota bacterium]
MDEIAIISDIHGNVPALEVVLEDIHQRGIEEIYCLGDLVGKGPESAQAVDLCQKNCEGIVQGNWDEFIQQPTTKESRLWHQRQLGNDRMAYLAALPGVIDLTLSGQHLRLYHASQENVHHRVYYWEPYEKLQAMFENTPFTGEFIDKDEDVNRDAHEEQMKSDRNRGGTSNLRAQPDVVIYGDIHHAFMLPVNGNLLINAGSVGNPCDGIPMASYLIVKGEKGKSLTTTGTPISVEFVRQPFDIEGAIAIARHAEMPRLAEYAFELRHGRYRRHMPEGYVP